MSIYVYMVLLSLCLIYTFIDASFARLAVQDFIANHYTAAAIIFTSQG
jgi:hypothetical protein